MEWEVSEMDRTRRGEGTYEEFGGETTGKESGETGRKLEASTSERGELSDEETESRT